MYTLEALITLMFVSLVIGLIAGAVIAQRTAPSKQSQQDLEKNLEDLQKQQQHYQQDVAKHFSQTGQLLDQLTKSYRDVHNHLANGAQILAEHEAGESIDKLPDGPEQSPQSDDETNLMPPLDYAPKSTPHEKGMLNEKFGLDKVKTDTDSEQKPAPTAATPHN